MSEAVVYHLSVASELRAHARDGRYAPASFAADGFLHCSTRAQTLPVADDYFATANEPVVLLELDAKALGDALVYEAPAPIPGGGTAHLMEGKLLFPHLYAPLALTHVTRAARLERTDDHFVWPDAWTPLARWLDETD